jgi:hypothetical protein
MQNTKYKKKFKYELRKFEFLLYYIPLAWSYPTIWLLTLVSVKPKNLLLGFTDIANNFIKWQTN